MACDSQIMQISGTSLLDSHTSVKIPHTTISDSTRVFSNEKRCEETAGLETRVLFYMSSSLKTEKKNVKSSVIRPTPFQLLLLSATMCIETMDKLIKLIHHYQTLPFSTNESRQSICSYNHWNVTEICSRPHWLLFVQRLPDQEGHLNMLNKLHGPTISPPFSSRRRRRLTVLESCTDPQGSITITITQMCTYTSWLVRDSLNCPRQMFWSCTLYKSAGQYRENSTSTINPEAQFTFPERFPWI